MCPTSLVADESPVPLLDWETDVPQYLLSPCTERSDGVGPVIDLGLNRGDLFVVTLGINHVTERECLTIYVWGSADGIDWGPTPLVAVLKKCYCGLYSAFLDLSKHPQVRYLRVQWNMLRWGIGDHPPLFGFYVSAQASTHKPS
jgi:hypothetical protein